MTTKFPRGYQPSKRRADLMRHTSFLNWKLTPLTVLKAHIHYLDNTGAVQASCFKLARWAKVNQSTISRYQVAMRSLGLLGDDGTAVRGQRKVFYLDVEAVKKLSDLDGAELVKRSRKQCTGNTQDKPRPLFKKERNEGKKQGFSKAGNVFAFDQGKHPGNDRSSDGDGPTDAEKKERLKAAFQFKAKDGADD